MTLRKLTLILSALTLTLATGCPDEATSGAPDSGGDVETDGAGGDGGVFTDIGEDDGGDAFVLDAEGDVPTKPDGAVDAGEDTAPDVTDAGPDAGDPDTDAGPTDPCDPNPCEVAPAPACAEDGVTLVTPVGPSTCAAVEGGHECAFTETTLDCSLEGGTCADGACQFPQPAAGELVISEIMYDPHFGLSDNTAEWFEVTSVVDAPRSLDGCTLSDDGGNSTPVEGLVIAAGQRLVFAASAENNGGIPFDALFGFSLGNTGDTIAIACGEVVVDQVVYTSGGAFPKVQGKALSLDPAATDATLNDDGASWCAAPDVYFTAPEGMNYGSPGAVNPPCTPPADTTIDWCRLQWPLDAEALAGTNVTVFGRVYEEGVTDASDAVDANPLLIGEAGYGTDGSDPAAGGWAWFAASGNPAWDAAVEGEPGNDEYQASVVVPEAGTYDHAVRFSRDGGATWTYCDRAAGEGSDGSQDGYQPANAGSLVSLPSPCDPNPCMETPAPVCTDGATLVTYASPGTCAVIEGAAACTYAEATTDCAETGAACIDGACQGGAVAPVAGDVIVTEILYDPHGDLSDTTDEWFELTNVSGGSRLLTGCIIAGNSGSKTLGPVVLSPGAAAVFVRSAANTAALVPVDTFSFALGNESGSVTLTCGGEIVDAVAYDEANGWPTAQYRSLSLDPAAYDAAGNDDPASWCLATEAYYVDPDGAVGNNYGTPGATNPTCPEPDPTVDWCRLQWPLDAEVLAGTSVTVFGRVFDEGVTDVSPQVDNDPMLLGEAGYGPDGSDPTGDDWAWVSASGNPAWDGEEQGEPANDEYEATFIAPSPGTHDHAFRFSLDAGATWTYCDRDAGDGADGSEDGYQPANAGSLVALSSPCEVNPCVEAPAPECDDAVMLVTYVAPGTCTVVDDAASCTYAEQTTDCSITGGVCEAGACVGGAVAPVAGEVIVTEILYDPHGDLSDTTDEWFELTNLADGSRDLDGCTISGKSGTKTLAGLVLPASGAALFIKSATNVAGLVPDATFAFALGNESGSVTLTCGGATIDAVVYDETAGWPVAQYRSLSLAPEAHDAALNDDPASWCLSDEVYYADPDGPAGDNYGTPGAANPACAVADTTVDWCRLQWPLDAEVEAGSVVTAYGRVYEAGITDQTGGVDVDPALVGQVGYGPDGSEPDGNPEWTWTDATPNPVWDGPFAGEAGNDEYMASFETPAPGTYDHAYRFSLDGGETWTLCDRDAGPGADGSEDGYQTANAGSLVTIETSDPCLPNPCTAAPLPECDDATTLRTFTAPGTCTAVEGAPICEYPSSTSSCALTGATCESGACVGGAATPLQGQVIFTEIMVDPRAPLLDATAEWFELQNLTGTALALHGCTVGNAAGGTSTIEGLLVAADSAVVLARSEADSGGVGPDALFGFSLVNAGDTLTLTCAGSTIDAVTWDGGATFPAVPGSAMSLDPASYDAAANDAGAAWCAATEAYYLGGTPAEDNFGTPGLENPPCPVVDTTVDWCRLQWPLDVTDALVGSEVTIYGRVFEAGLTDLTAAVDVAPNLVGQAGYGPFGTEPGDGWVWADGEANATWDGVDQGEPANDEYMATLIAPAAGSYDHAFRFSVDSGATWTYCDRAAGLGSDGAEDGYQIDNAGSLVTIAGPCEPNPCLAIPAPVCEGDVLRTFSGPGVCTPKDGAPVCAFPSVTMDCALDGGTCADGACMGGAAQPAAGEVIITEIMPDPHGDIADSTGEWFELHNLADGPRTLDGCSVKDASTISNAIVGVTIDAGGYVVFANSMINNGNLPQVDHLFTFALNNGGDTLTLTCDAGLIDEVIYGAATGFPSPNYHALSLDPGAHDATANDAGASWCQSMSAYYVDPDGAAGDNYGTPGAPNPSCPVIDTTVDWCRLQWPLDVTLPAGSDLTIYGRVYEEGITDATNAVDPDPNLIGQAGFGIDGSDPTTDATWTWAPAVPNPGWNGTDSGEPNNDEYEATLPAPLPGVYDHAFRFSRDGGLTWTYCDIGGSQDGYQVAEAGNLVTEASACAPNPCIAPPPAGCHDATTIVTYAAPGICSLDGDVAVCAWEEELVTCAPESLCDGGVCVATVSPAVPTE